MEQTKAIILCWPETATVPGSLAITIIHMLLSPCLHCFSAVDFFFPPVWKNSCPSVFRKTHTHTLSFSAHTHSVKERDWRDREFETVDPPKIKPFSPPISLERQSVLNDFQNRRWFVSVSPLDFICRIQRSKGHAACLRWALIAWTPAQSLNALVWMSLPQCQLKKTCSEFLLSLADATHGETLAPPTDCD